MTKDELEKEAEFRTKGWKEQKNCIQAYLAGAEPREKQIEHLSKEVDDLENMKATLESTIAELKAQIEKMKCCGNCKNEGDYKEPYRYGTGWCNICKRHKVAKGNFDKWEIKEK